MPYTNEQAKDAIAKHHLQEIFAKHRLQWHKWSVEGVTTYNLPYRVLWDYYNADWDYMDIQINPWYPLPKIPKDLQIPYDERRLLDRDEIQRQEADAYEKYRPWRLDTQDGIERWKRYFTCFIAPYADDIDTWSEFDLYGVSGHDQGEVERKRKFYKKLVQDYIERPDRYEQRRRKQVADYDLYDFADGNGYMWSKLHPDATLEVLLKEQETAREYYRREKQRYQESTGEARNKWDMIGGIMHADDYLYDVDSAIKNIREMVKNT